MKKYLSLFLTLGWICIFAAGCTDRDALNAESFVSESENSNPEKQQSSVSAGVSVDVDLTVLSSTMVYAEVYNMMVRPDDYIGKVVKMRGPYYTSYYDETDKYYHYVIIEDATACCQQGLEFIWDGGHTYPDDYPENNKNIEVVGVFESYEELGSTYYYLAAADISILE